MESTSEVGVEAINPSHALAVLLKQVGNFQRAPKGWAECWRKIDQDRVAKTFFVEGGFTAWFAYSLTKHRAESHSNFDGKADCRRLISDLGPQSDENLRSLAMEVASSVPPNVGEKINRMRRTAESAGTDNLLEHDSIHSMEPMDILTNIPSLSTKLSPAINGRPALGDSAQTLTRDLNDTLNGFAQYRQIQVGASLTATAKQFPSFLAGAIKRIPKPDDKNTLVAAISMAFPNEPPFRDQCQMSLEIMDNKIEHLASLLFRNVHLETTAGLRYVCLPGISKVLPNPHLTLRGCPQDALRSVLGGATSDGIAASPAYKEEVKQGFDFTECVSMVVSQRAQDEAFLFISLGLREGTLMSDSLYSRF